MKDLVGNISIGRLYGHDVENPIRIEVRDEDSHCLVAEIRMDLTAFAQAVTGTGGMKCAVKYNEDRLGRLGKQVESKTELVPFKWAFRGSTPAAVDAAKTAAAKAADPFLIDGWSEYRESDFFNHHCWSKQGEVDCQRVVFWRYVDKNSPAFVQEEAVVRVPTPAKRGRGTPTAAIPVVRRGRNA